MKDNIFNDGANWQAQAVAAYVFSRDGIESSWSNENRCYMAEPTIARWYNGREQGYVISMTVDYKRQINIAFFEHRNSDCICAVLWEQDTINPPTIDSMDTKGTVYKDKWDTSFSVSFGEVVKMGDWILEQLANFYQIAKKVEK